MLVAFLELERKQGRVWWSVPKWGEEGPECKETGQQREGAMKSDHHAQEDRESERAQETPAGPRNRRGTFESPSHIIEVV